MMETIFHNGAILTMAGDTPKYVEALGVKHGKVEFVGTLKEALKLQGKDTNMVDLGHRTLLPGFLDGHSHYYNSLVASSQCCVYASPSESAVNNVDRMIEVLQAFREEKQIEAGGILIAYGYDETVFGELLNRGHLDEAFPDIRVRVEHVSMHGGVLNLNAMKYYGFYDLYPGATPDDPPRVKQEDVPPGGVINTNENDEIWGLIMETAWEPCVHKLEDLGDPFDATIEGQKLYAEQGITTAQEGATMAGQFAIIKEASHLGANMIDVVTYPFVTEVITVDGEGNVGPLPDHELEKEFMPLSKWCQYHKGLKIGGVKITLDGSPQGRTALFTTPYNKVNPDDDENWCGEPTFPQEMAIQCFKVVHDFKVPLLVHTNGDGAIDNMIDAYDKTTGEDTTPWNVTTIHTQFMRSDHIPKFVSRSIRPSFYTLHTFYFADAHLRNRGEFQANYISPMRHAINQGLRPSNHTDAVVAPLDQMMMLWSAVNRVSRDINSDDGYGPVFGESQCITPYEGLKAMTEWAAEQYEEEAIKGTLEVGKNADLVILDKDPLLVNKLDIKNIKVIATIKKNNTIYLREGETVEGLPAVKLPERQDKTPAKALKWIAAHICDMCEKNPVAEKIWKLEILEGKDVAADKPPTIAYGRGVIKKLEAFGGINDFTASYAIVSERVITGKLKKKTDNTGSKEMERLEKSFTKMISKVEAFKISPNGNRLTLTDGGKNKLAVFKLVES